jgi:hypothetical protein
MRANAATPPIAWQPPPALVAALARLLRTLAAGRPPPGEESANEYMLILNTDGRRARAAEGFNVIANHR